MPAPVIIEFLLRGMPDVTRAFRTVEQAALASERSRSTAAQRGGRERATVADKEAREKIRAMLKADREVRRAQDQGTREASQAAKRRTRDEKREMDQLVREAEKSANARIRIEQRVDREFAQMRKRQERERDRVIRNDEQQTARAARATERIAAKRASADEGSRERFVRSAFGGVRSGVSTIAKGVTAVGGMVGQLGGGFSIADSVMSEANLRKKASVISASTILSGAGTPGADKGMGRAVSTKEVLSQAKAIGLEHNIDPAQVLEGIDQVKKLTGNVEKAMQAMPGIAKLATATGGDVGQMSGLAANIFAANPNIDNAELQKQMRIFTKQGVVGGIEVGDFARYGSRITAAASAYGTDASKGITKETNEATLGAMAQMSRQYGSASTPAEAAMGALRFTTDIAKHSDTLKSNLGIDVSDGKGGLKNMQAILTDMVVKTGGDITKFKKTGLGDRGVKPLEGAAAIYRNAGGGKAGLDALTAEFKKYTTGVTEAEVDAAEKRVLAEQQAEIAVKKLQIAVGEQLLPELLKLVPVLQRAMPSITKLLEEFVKIADWAGSNPFAAMTALMIASVTKSIVAAQLGEVIKRLLIGGGGPGGGGGGAAVLSNGAGLLKSPVGLGVAAGVAAGAVAGNSELKYSEGTEKAQDLAAKVRAWKRGDTERGVAPEQAMQEIAQAKGRLDKNSPLGLNQVGNIIASPFSDSASKEYSQYKTDQAVVDNKDLIAALKEVATAVKSSGGMPGAGAPKPGGAATSTGIAQRTQ